MSNPSFSTSSLTPDRLIAGDFPRRTRDLVIASVPAGGLPRGAILGIVTASGKALLSASGAGDGSQVPDCVLAAAVAEGTDVEATVYETGEFDASQVTFGTGHDADTVRADLRLRCIWLNSTVAA